jgi:hypothetical protein
MPLLFYSQASLTYSLAQLHHAHFTEPVARPCVSVLFRSQANLAHSLAQLQHPVPQRWAQAYLRVLELQLPHPGALNAHAVSNAGWAAAVLGLKPSARWVQVRFRGLLLFGMGLLLLRAEHFLGAGCVLCGLE